MNCERCEELGITIPAEKDSELCGDCQSSEAEAAHERFLEDYYGGSRPVTLQERYDQAVKDRAELRRRD